MAETLFQALPAAAGAPLFPTTDEINVLTIDEAHCNMAAFNRRDLFKVMLVVSGENELHYATRSYSITRPALVFTNRLIPYSWEQAEGADEQEGFICPFTETFLQAAMRGVNIKESVLYKADGNPVYFLDEEQLRYFTDAFTRMRRDLHSDYPHKFELLRNQLSIIIHEAARLQPATPQHAPTNAAERITDLFMTLLNVQFPVSAHLHEPLLKKASEYADRMAVHVNHLNAVLQEVTGKSTSAHINERLITEAKLLLAHTDQSISQIADSLGFGYPTYFTNFFKRHTGSAPLAFRKIL